MASRKSQDHIWWSPAKPMSSLRSSTPHGAGDEDSTPARRLCRQPAFRRRRAKRQFGPFPPTLVADWLVARLDGKSFASERWFVQPTGQVVKTAL
jgi:hypothetical protein